MLASYPSGWLLLALPFLSMFVIRGVPSLLILTGRRNSTMRLIGVVGLAAMAVALIRVIPPVFGLPMMVLGGGISGFAVFTLPRQGGSDDDDGRWSRPPPDYPRPPETDGPLDRGQFDRIRAQWERRPVLKRWAVASSASALPSSTSSATRRPATSALGWNP